MDKLRKIGEWLWKIKEKIVLCALVIVLCVRVYGVAVKSPPVMPDYRMPKARWEPPEGAMPPSWPDPPDRPDTTKLQENNPFTTRSLRRDSDDMNVQDTRPNLTVLKIQQTPKGPRVEIRTQTVRPKWYEEGEPFESFEIIRIDVENLTVDIYSEEHRNTFTVKVEGT